MLGSIVTSGVRPVSFLRSVKSYKGTTLVVSTNTARRASGPPLHGVGSGAGSRVRVCESFDRWFRCSAAIVVLGCASTIIWCCVYGLFWAIRPGLLFLVVSALPIGV